MSRSQVNNQGGSKRSPALQQNGVRMTDSSLESSILWQLSDYQQNQNPSEETLPNFSEDFIDMALERNPSTNSQRLEELEQILSPIKINPRANFFEPMSEKQAKEVRPAKRIAYTAMYQNHSENLPSKAMTSSYPNPSSKIPKKITSIEPPAVKSCQYLDQMCEDKAQAKEKNRKELREDLKNFLEFRKNLKKEQGPTNFCQEMFKGFKISEVRSFLKSQVTNA